MAKDDLQKARKKQIEGNIKMLTLVEKESTRLLERNKLTNCKNTNVILGQKLEIVRFQVQRARIDNRKR